MFTSEIDQIICFIAWFKWITAEHFREGTQGRIAIRIWWRQFRRLGYSWMSALDTKQQDALLASKTIKICIFFCSENTDNGELPFFAAVIYTLLKFTWNLLLVFILDRTPNRNPLQRWYLTEVAWQIVVHDCLASTTGLGILDWSKLYSKKFVQMQLNSVYDIKQVARSSFVGFYLICDKRRCLNLTLQERDDYYLGVSFYDWLTNRQNAELRSCKRRITGYSFINHWLQ